MTMCQSFSSRSRCLRPRVMMLSILFLAHAACALTPKWTALPSASGDPRVSGHATAIDKSGRVLCFGGLTGSAGSPCTDALWAYDDGWEQLETNGGPGPRMYAAAAALGDNFYVFGGWDPEAPGSGGTFKDEVWSFDVPSKKWSQLAPMPCGPVSRHTACTVGDLIVVHTFRGVLVMDSSGELREQSTSGDAPTDFSMCACAALGDSRMLIFGGSTKSQGMSDVVYLLDTATWAWSKLRSESDKANEGGRVPTPRASSCAASVDDRSCVVFGGAGLGGGGYEGGGGLRAFDETWLVEVTDDNERAVWTEVDVAVAGGGGGAHRPPARVAASLNRLGGEGGGGRYLLQGGWDPASKETFDAPHVLTL